MTYSTILDSCPRLTLLVGRIFTNRRLPAVAALAVVLALVTGVLPGAVTPAFAQDKAPPPSVAAVNINKADAVSIASALKGVGNARAQEIVRYREAYGPFSTVDELADVKGIGKSTLEDNRARITLE
jgi:competence protein ComEA